MSEQPGETGADISPGTMVDLDLLPTLNWMIETVGSRLLTYMLNVDDSQVDGIVSGMVGLTSQQRDSVQYLTRIRNYFTHLNGPVAADNRQYVRYMMTARQGDAETSVANAVREITAGPEDLPETPDELEREIAFLAAETFPAFLLPVDENFPFMPDDPVVSPISRTILTQHPDITKFTETALRDPTIGAMFQRDTGNLADPVFIHMNIGMGTAYSPSQIPDSALRSAWKNLVNGVNRIAFAEAAILELRALRSLISDKEKVQATVKRAFMGALLPRGTKISIGGGTLSEVTEKDRRIAPEQLRARGAIQTNDFPGGPVSITSDGDILWSYEFPFKIKIDHDMIHPKTPFIPETQQRTKHLDKISKLLQFSFALALKQGTSTQILPTWQAFSDPLTGARTVQFANSNKMPKVQPRQLSDDDVAEWVRWFDHLEKSPLPRIELAMNRILAALAERTDPTDVLVDSVIAWESLFGPDRGELSFRITAGLAKLLAPTPDKEEEHWKRYKDIYSLRSRIVHGSGPIKDGENEMCYDALDIAIKAVKILITDRIDILELPNSADRSAKLLLNSGPKEASSQCT